MMEAQCGEARSQRNIPLSTGLENMPEKEKAITKKSVRRRGSLDSMEKFINANLCGCVSVCRSCDCERAYVPVYLEKVKNECRKIVLRNQNNDDDGVSLLDEFNRG